MPRTYKDAGDFKAFRTHYLTEIEDFARRAGIVKNNGEANFSAGVERLVSYALAHIEDVLDQPVPAVEPSDEETIPFGLIDPDARLPFLLAGLNGGPEFWIHAADCPATIAAIEADPANVSTYDMPNFARLAQFEYIGTPAEAWTAFTDESKIFACTKAPLR